MPFSRMLHIVDDDTDVRESAELLLDAAGYTVVAWPSGVAFLAGVDTAVPACVLLDINMPQIDGLEVQRQFIARGVTWPVILLTGQGEVSVAVQAMKNGGFEYLEKPYSSDLLLATVKDAFSRLEASHREEAAVLEAKTRLAKLTARELQVTQGLLAGLPNKLIAHELQISGRTVEIHRANVMDKLDVRSLSALVRMALAAGIKPLNS